MKYTTENMAGQNTTGNTKSKKVIKQKVPNPAHVFFKAYLFNKN